MNHPVRVRKNVHALFQAVLKRPGLEQRPTFRPVRRRNHDLPHPPMVLQPYRLVSYDLDQKVLQARVDALVHVPDHVGPHQLRVVAPRHHPYADEGREERRALQHDLVGEGVVEGQTGEVEEHLGQRQEGEQAEEVEDDGPSVAVLHPGVDLVVGVVAELEAAGEDLEGGDQGEEEAAVEVVLRFAAQHLRGGGGSVRWCNGVRSILF